MLRVSSEAFTNNHHSLNKKSNPSSLCSSQADSLLKNRKVSVASIKENIPDLEKLIRDIKISPNVSDEDAIKKIDSCLKELSHNSQVCNEVQGMKMLLATIEKKIKKPSVRKESAATQSSSKKNSLQATAIKINQISPIKQIPDEANSRILYTNFSLRGIEKSIVSEKDSISFQSSEKKNPIKVTISKFDEEQTSETDKLNQEIRYLEQLLRKKTGGNRLGDKKKSAKY